MMPAAVKLLECEATRKRWRGVSLVLWRRSALAAEQRRAGVVQARAPGGLGDRRGSAAPKPARCSRADEAIE
jgi:hypothetical protein